MITQSTQTESGNPGHEKKERGKGRTREPDSETFLFRPPDIGSFSHSASLLFTTNQVWSALEQRKTENKSSVASSQSFLPMLPMTCWYMNVARCYVADNLGKALVVTIPSKIFSYLKS